MAHITRRRLAAVAGASLLAAPAIAQDKNLKLTVGVIKMAALTDPYVAQKLGMYGKHGLDVTFVDFNSGAEAISAGQGGSIDIYLAIPGTVMTANDRGFDMVTIFQNEVAKAAGPDTGSVQVRKDSDIKSLADLKGKKVVIQSLHAQNTVALQQMLQKLGIKVTDVTWIEIPFTSQADMLRTKQADAVATVDPFTTQLLASGVGRVISWYYVDSLPKQPLGAWWGKRAYIAKNGEAVARFNAAMKEAIDYMLADPDRARANVTEYSGLKPELVKDMPIIGWDYHVSVPRWQAVCDMMYQMGEMSKPHKVTDFFAPQIKPYIVEE
jgi:NitT/TauT family transport system substrate-binding protein